MKALKSQEPKQRKAFWNKYLAAIFAVAALLISSVVSAQTDSLKYSQINGYGFKYKRHAQDSISIIPLSTSPHTPYRAGGIRYRASDSTLQLWTGYQWNSIVTGIGNGVDTAYALNDSTIAIETPDEDFFVQIPGRYWDLQGILNNGSTLTENETITLLDSLRLLSGLVVVETLRISAIAASTDTTTYKPISIDASGNVRKFGSWPGSGSSADSTIFSTNYRRDTALANIRQTYGKVYNILDYGAKGDGKEKYDAVTTSGSPTLTSATAIFTAADVGKAIRIYRAGASGQDLVTTIAGFTNATTITLATNASSNQTNDTIIYGTNNVPFIQAALDAANAGGGDATVLIPPPGFGKFYVLGGELDHSGGDCNCQIRIPVSGIRDTSFNNRKSIVIDGLMPPGQTPSALFADTLTPKMNTTLVSIIHGSGIRPAVFGSIDTSFLYANGINYNMATVRNIALLVEQNRAGGGPDIGGFNFYNMSSSPMENVLVSWNGPIHGTAQPTNEVAGIIAGQLSSEIYTTMKNVGVFGFKYGLVITESVSLDHAIVHACVNGITLIHGNYPVVGGYVDAHWCKNSVYVPQSTILGDISPGLVYFNFQNLALEVFQGSGLGAPAWLDYTHIISDSASYGRGHIFGYTLGQAEVGINNSMFNKYGADSIFCYETGSAADRNTKINAGLTSYAGWQNGGLRNYWYNWSPLNDASIMRLAPVTDGSQGLYISPTGTGGVGLPKAWINLYNSPLWTGVNTTSGNTELLQFSANGTNGYSILSTQSGTGTIRDLNIGNGTYATQLKIAANGTTSINNTTVDDALVINGSSTNRVSFIINNANATGSASLYVQNNRGSFNAYGGMLTGGASDPAGSIFGLTRPDKTFIIHDGANGLGFGIGTLNTQPLVFGTDNAERIRISGAGAISFNTSTNSYTFPSTRASAGQVLTDVAGDGALDWATPSGGTTLYSGDGTLAGNRVVTGNNLSLTYDDILAYRINSDYNIIAKANGTAPYSEAIIGTPNAYWIGYTPTGGVYSKGPGMVIDTNNNVGLGTQPPTTMPLYATGASTFIQGLQSNAANFYKVENHTTDFTVNLSGYFHTLDATSGNITVTLPAASAAFGNTMGITYKFQRIDNSGNTVTIQRAGSDTINGGTSFTITTQWTEVRQVQCTSTSTWAQWQ